MCSNVYSWFPAWLFQNDHSYIVIVHITDSTVHFMGCVQWFHWISRWVLLLSLSVPLHVISFLFKWHLSASVSRPTGMASGRWTAGAGEPAVRWASQASTAQTRDREAPPFLEQKQKHGQGWHVDTEEEKKMRGLLCERVNLVSHDAAFLSLTWWRFSPGHSYITTV